MTAVYEYKGPEQPLGTPLVTIRCMQVDTFTDDGTTLEAHGTFSFRDRVEGGDFTEPWTASGTFMSTSFKWEVRRKEPGPGDYPQKSASGEPIFTGIPTVNTAISRFIAEALTNIALWTRSNRGKPIKIVHAPREYIGMRHQYTGACVCDALKKSCENSPFDWMAHTDGGKFPNGCFECSCGKQWYRGMKEMWAKVTDPAAWEMLTKHDGQVTETLALDPRAKDPEIVLERTIRSLGYIPLG